MEDATYYQLGTVSTITGIQRHIIQTYVLVYKYVRNNIWIEFHLFERSNSVSCWSPPLEVSHYSLLFTQLATNANNVLVISC